MPATVSQSALRPGTRRTGVTSPATSFWCVTSILHADRFFDPEPGTRLIAREIYESVGDLPLICPHGHVDASIFASDEPFPDPASLIVSSDHYILRMLYSQGIPMETLGLSPRDGTPVQADPRDAWRRFASNYFLFRGTPSKAWVDHVLHEVFELARPLSADTADVAYDEISEKLASREFRPRALFDRFRIEVLATTDGATDPLASHAAVRASGWQGRVIPTFRPDALFSIASSAWRSDIESLARVAGTDIRGFDAFLDAVRQRRRFFISRGATATDHGVESPRTRRLPPPTVHDLFRKALGGTATAHDQAGFGAHMLLEMAQMSTEDGLVMQLHAGSARNHNRYVHDKFGPDKGADIPLKTEYTRNLRELLNEFGNDPRFSLIVFTLDESAYSRELAPLAGHYPALRLGPAWWFHDSIEGMTRYREQTTETAGIYNTAGFNDDTRAFCSIPARHDMSRRVDANFLARLTARHRITKGEAIEMARALAYDLPKRSYRLDAIDVAGQES